MTEESDDRADALFHALADRTRRDILRRTLAGEHSVSTLAASAVTLLFGVGIIQALLAFAPGAMEALTVIAFQMNIDPAYVAAHHVARFVALVIAVPILARWLERRP